MSQLGSNFVYGTIVSATNGTTFASPVVNNGGKHIITALSFYCVAGVSGNLRLGLYDASGTGGQPGVLLGESASTAAIAGWNLIALASAATITPGNYWLAWQFDAAGNVTVKTTDAANSSWSYAKAYGAFDANFNATPTGATDLYAMYGTYSETDMGDGGFGPALVQELKTDLEVDGERNAVIAVNITTDGGNLPLQTLVNPKTLAGSPSRFRVDKIQYAVRDQMAVYLYWEGQLNHANLWRLAGRGQVPNRTFGGIQNTAVDPTGNILVSTRGWTPSTGELSASFVLKLVKQ